MSETKSLCAVIPKELHAKVRNKQEISNVTLNQYIEQLLIEYYQMKEGENMSKTKTLAIQIPQELSVKIKNHIAKTPKLTLKGFLTEIIVQALNTDDLSENSLHTDDDIKSFKSKI